jgi:hypothetical protein
VKNKPNRPLSRLINHFNKDAPPSDTQHLTISQRMGVSAYGRIGGRRREIHIFDFESRCAIWAKRVNPQDAAPKRFGFLHTLALPQKRIINA